VKLVNDKQTINSSKRVNNEEIDEDLHVQNDKTDL
jgi:hypothetical protein